MNQERFEASYGADWQAFEAWLSARSVRVRRGEPRPAVVPDREIPRRYRALCQHLALARDRQYSTTLVERLHDLVMRGHQFLYGAHPEAGPRVAQFFAADFPRAVRAAWRPLAVACVLFYGPVIGLTLALQYWPDFIYTLMPAEQARHMREMYDPANRVLGRREAETDAYMLGFYIWNNVRIGFQTFAGGLLYGLGTVFFLVFNGVMIGAVAGHLIEVGFTTTFFSFVAGHSAPELTAIVVMGAAGLVLGRSLVMPGSLTRGHALRIGARAAVPLVYGAAALFVLAAFIEAFWSPITALPPASKYAAGIGMWALVIVWLALGGRRRAA